MTDRIARMFPIAALCIVSAVALAACGGGGGKKAAPTPTPDEMQVMPAVDHPDTLGEALAIAAGQTVDGRIDSAGDRDFFRLPLTEASTVTFWTSGEADTLVALLDGEGNDLAADTDGRASVETELSNVYARVRGGPNGGTGGYRLHNEVVARAGGNGSPGGEWKESPLNDCVDVKFYRSDLLSFDVDGTPHPDLPATCTTSAVWARVPNVESFKNYTAAITNMCSVRVHFGYAFNISSGRITLVHTRAGKYWEPYAHGSLTAIDPGSRKEFNDINESYVPSGGCLEMPPTSLHYCVYGGTGGVDDEYRTVCGVGGLTDGQPPPTPPYREIRIGSDDWIDR